MVKKQEIVSVLVLDFISPLLHNEQNHQSILSSYLHQHSVGHNLPRDKNCGAALPRFPLCGVKTSNCRNTNGYYWLGDVQES